VFGLNVAAMVVHVLLLFDRSVEQMGRIDLHSLQRLRDAASNTISIAYRPLAAVVKNIEKIEDASANMKRRASSGDTFRVILIARRNLTTPTVGGLQHTLSYFEATKVLGRTGVERLAVLLSDQHDPRWSSRPADYEVKKNLVYDLEMIGVETIILEDETESDAKANRIVEEQINRIRSESSGPSRVDLPRPRAHRSDPPRESPRFPRVQRIPDIAHEMSNRFKEIVAVSPEEVRSRTADSADARRRADEKRGAAPNPSEQIAPRHQRVLDAQKSDQIADARRAEARKAEAKRAEKRPARPDPDIEVCTRIAQRFLSNARDSCGMDSILFSLFYDLPKDAYGRIRTALNRSIDSNRSLTSQMNRILDYFENDGSLGNSHRAFNREFTLETQDALKCIFFDQYDTGAGTVSRSSLPPLWESFNRVSNSLTKAGLSMTRYDPTNLMHGVDASTPDVRVEEGELLDSEYTIKMVVHTQPTEIVYDSGRTEWETVTNIYPTPGDDHDMLIIHVSPLQKFEYEDPHKIFVIDTGDGTKLMYSLSRVVFHITAAHYACVFRCGTTDQWVLYDDTGTPGMFNSYQAAYDKFVEIVPIVWDKDRNRSVHEPSLSSKPRILFFKRIV
jgi:hypothetical protein